MFLDVSIIIDVASIPMEVVKEKVQKIVSQAKEAANNGNFHESLQLFKFAYKLSPSEKLKKRIDKLQVLFIYLRVFCKYIFQKVSVK